MPRPRTAHGPARPAMSDGGHPAPQQDPRRRLARDLFLLGLRDALDRSGGQDSGEASESLATLLARSLAGISPVTRTAAPMVAGVSGGC